MIPHHRHRPRTACCLLIVVCALLIAGCQQLGYVASNVSPPGKGPEPERYKAMAGQTAAVMVWADSSVRIDFTELPEHIGSAIQDKLVNEGQRKLNCSELRGTVFPCSASGLVRFQKDHPEITAMPITDAALRPDIKGLSRLIYIEVGTFETRIPQSQQLYRGHAIVTLKVVEIKDGRTARIGFEDNRIEVYFPLGSSEPLAGSDDVTDDSMCQGTMTAIAYEVARRFYPPPED